ncbi:MAG: cyclic nucleotide-binding domain-containing protein, partial [Fimbriimonadaceae bacterium]|nr:cyclic nucleotide-binding domain-containing protein [Alphaproteobacteria bacterium]
YDMITAKINCMRDAEDRLMASLIFEDNDDYAPHRTVSAAANGNDSLARFIPLLRALPLFACLSDDVFDRLLGQAEIRRYEKGRLLVVHGEPASRYYVVLSGWVKLFKGTSSGDEIVLQMLTSGDSVQEAAVFLDAPAPVSAEIAENAVLFSVPAPLIRRAVRENAELAVSMLDSLSQRSENLIKQMEQSRLHSAPERVGWFLLKRQLEDGGPRVGTIVLPYDKALIASYLDMTPETFSRTLKRFRDSGFEVENNTITLPAPYGLCAYCDSALGAICRFRGDDGCPNMEFK